MMGQVLNIVHFAEFVRNKQGVSEQFWEVLSPVVGASKFNFRYLGEAKSPNRPNQKHVARRGHGKSPRKSIVQEEEESREEIEEERPCKKGKKAPPRSFRMGSTINPSEETSFGGEVQEVV